MAGVGIDLDLGDVHAVGKVSGVSVVGLGVEVFGDFAALLHLGGARSDVEQRHPAVGADDFEIAVLVGDVGFAGFEHGGGDRLAFFEMVSIAFTIEWPAVIAEREPTEA